MSNTGLVAFDNDGSGPAVVYNSAGQLVATGLTDGHRQPRLSGDGRFLATTCASSCVADHGLGASPYVQDLAGPSDTGFPNDAGFDEANPCIDADGSLVGLDKGAARTARHPCLRHAASSPP